MELAACHPAQQNGDVHRQEHLPKPSITALKVHLYHSSQSESDCTPLYYPPGEYVAEQLAIDAAKECGESSADTEAKEKNKEAVVAV